MARDVIKMSTGVGQQAFSRRSLLRQGRLNSHHEPAEYFIQHRAVKRVLILEVIIKQGLIDLGGTCNRVSASARKSLLGELADSRAQNRGLALGGTAAGAESGFKRSMHQTY